MEPPTILIATVAISGAVGFYLGWRLGKMEGRASVPFPFPAHNLTKTMWPGKPPDWWPTTFCAMGCGCFTDGVQDFCARCISEYHLDDPYR